MSWPEEIFAAVLSLAREEALWLAVSVILIAAALAVWGYLPLIARKVLVVVSLAAGTIVGLTQAWQTKWLADDAYISFTYALRFVEGHGFVLNPGEYVEGYTNFLWVAVLGLLGKLGAPIPEVALAGNLLCFVTLVLVAWRLPATVAAPESRPVWPLAALAVALGRPFQVFATSGLESDVALALCALGVLAWARHRPFVGGALLGLGAMARPDHLLLTVAVALTAFTDSMLARSTLRQAVMRAARVFAPAVGLFTLYWLWRWQYYGEFFPNTFHAKSGGGSYFTQGWVYATHAFLAGGLVLAGLALLWALPWLIDDPRRRPLVLLPFAVLATHGLYVIRVGGDFMEFRFLLPTIYFVIVASEVICRAKLEGRVAWVTAAWAVPLAVMWAPMVWNPRPIKPFEKKWFLAAEETYYQLKSGFPAEPVSDLARMGQQLEEAMVKKGVAPRFALGCIGMVGYFSHLPLMDTFGLANRRVAKHPIVNRGRPGHEKWASLEDMLADGAVFSDGNAWGPIRDAATRFYVAGRALWLVRYDDGLAELAQREGWHFPSIEATVNQMLQGYSRAQLEADRSFLERFLDQSAQRDEMLRRIDARLAGKDLDGVDATAIAPETLPEWVRRAEAFNHPELARSLLGRVQARWNFETNELNGRVEGNFWPPAEGTLQEQTAVSGYEGRRLVNTYRDVDRSMGLIELELPKRDDFARLNFLVGGGDDCMQVGVVLLDEDREVGRWCGRRDEVLRPVDVGLAGLRAPRLRIFDSTNRGWGHILVDDVMVYDASAMAMRPD